MALPFDPAVVLPIIAELLAQRHAVTYIANALTLRGILTAGGARRWNPSQVARLIKRHDITRQPPQP